MTKATEDRFFVGYMPLSRRLKIEIAFVSLGLIVGFALLGLIVSLTTPDPGPGQGYGRQTVTGVLQADPYPLLYVSQGTDRIPAGTTLLMSGQGKNGAGDQRVGPLAGQVATAEGLLLQRGTVQMLQLRGGRNGLKAAAAEAGAVAPVIPDAEPLGRWRLAGEICDGKCYAGIMRPGDGLAHKACANLCIVGGIPPIFVSSQPVERHEYLLLAGPDGGALPEALLTWTARYITLEGEIERRGDLLVFRVDPDSIEAS